MIYLLFNLPTLNCVIFSLLEKTIEKKHLKDEKSKGNKGMKISANSNENANVIFFHGIGKWSFVSLSVYVQVSQSDEIVHKSPVIQRLVAPLHVSVKD